MTTKIIYLHGKAVEVKVYPAIEPKSVTVKVMGRDRPKFGVKDYIQETITADYILVATFN